MSLPREYVSERLIRERIRELGTEVSRAFSSRRPVLLGLLRGCVPFLSELMLHLEIPFDLEFAQGSSYEEATSPLHAPTLRFPGDLPWKGRDVLVVDDILDTGATYAALRAELAAREVASVRLCVLLDKPSRRSAPVVPDWAGFEIPDVFAVGFGMDLAGDYRNLPWIGVLDE